MSISIILACSLYFTVLNERVFSPDFPYIHFLLFCLLITNPKPKAFFSDLIRPFSAVVYASYTFSGYYKMMTPFWVNGSFLGLFFNENSLARDWSTRIEWNPTALIVLTYFGLYCESLAFLAVFNRTLKVLFWFGLTGMHIAMLFLAKIPEVSIGMLVIHFYLIDEDILRAFSVFRKIKNAGSKTEAGVTQ